VTSWWRRLFPGAPPDSPADSTSPEVLTPVPDTPEEPLELTTLRAFAASGAGGFDAEGALLSLAGTSHEREALVAVTAAARHRELPDDLACAAASLFLERGQLDEARRLLLGKTSLRAYALSADVDARRGALDDASVALERALAIDFSAPGLHERLLALRARSGRAVAPAPRASADATLMTAAPRSPYRLLREAGRGGTATVYEAEDDLLGRRLAFKAYHRPSAAKEQIEREARVAIEVAGVGVASIYDASFDDGWLALEWAPLGALREALVRNDAALLLPLERWLDPLLRGLSRVHAAGWAHGDIKPGNVLFRSADAPLLADFGLARRAGEPWSGGTVGYLSPERARGEKATPLDDVFAVGRTLEEALDAFPGAGGRLRAVAARCRAPVPLRPSNASEVLALVESGR
jgi:eukaryotic-like serine/threonine-protein kinase